MGRFHIVTERIYDPETRQATFERREVPFTPEEEAAADIASIPTQEQYIAVIQMILDKAAVDRGYDNALSCISYKDSTNPSWSTEATTFIDWRDSVWSFSYGLLAEVLSGNVTQPSIEQFISQLPQITWPT